MPDFDLKRLKGKNLFVGTPMYDGTCTSAFAFAITQLTALCAQLDIGLRFYFLSHEALVTKARNITVDEFLRSGHDALLFIDADIGFDARDALHMLALQMQDAGERTYDVVAAPYPLKRLDWAVVRTAAKAGAGDADAALLARTSSRVAIHPAHDTSFPIDRPVEVTKAGTGFMMIRRATFERYRDVYPTRTYGPGSVAAAGEGATEMHAFFETEIDTKQGHLRDEIKAYLTRFPEATPAEMLAFLDSDEEMGSYSGSHISEDYAFCREVRAAGMKVWLCPWMVLTHTGTHTFTSRLADLGAIGVL
ncbi:hypothetical protein Q4F19_18515 [Sphingomonas sp. BIUV-7]|uniref:Uncharacterized protein n=1 Tax=Sphingomonas natans TaxID=3063330 RepID=A0ABT8YFE9_9SPHN|nr:hypothetical protein [Sphingomonas sp. BIUV-7]MDO6416385.1 hypothetical protein [Sphingomonas sp. BIUV-7]